MGLRKWFILALIVLIALGVTAPALAWKASKIGVSVGDFFFGNEASIQKPSATLFHAQTAAATDAEALAINFPGLGTDLIGSPIFAGAGPSIAQTVADTATATDTGFFKANYCYTSFANLGGYDLVPDVGAWHPIRSPSMLGSGVSWPYMNNAPLYGQSAIQFQPAITTAPDTSQISLASGNSMLQPGQLKNSIAGIGGNNSAKNATGGKANNVAMQGGNLSANNTPTIGKSGTNASKIKTPNRDYKNMTKTDISNSTGLERLYRNANMVNPIPKTYKGTVDRPTTIAPVKNAMADILLPANKSKVIGDSNNMTKAGTHLKTKGWDL